MLERFSRIVIPWGDVSTALYCLTTLFTDSDEFNMKSSHKPFAEERYLPRSTCASRAGAEFG
jgi:hypothetical protein